MMVRSGVLVLVTRRQRQGVMEDLLLMFSHIQKQRGTMMGCPGTSSSLFYMCAKNKTTYTHPCQSVSWQ